MKRLCLAVSLLACCAAPLAAGTDFDGWKNAPPPQPEVLVVRHATIWTSGPQGRLADADLLVRRGKVAAVGAHLAAPAGAVEIDATGRHVTPGIIDPHSHSDIVGNVNEGSNIITAEVRIEDVVNAESIAIYRELAGGVTAVNLLHGSANAIGGQNAVVKLRWGALPDEMFFGAPPGIKFALGENPKQSNWGDGGGGGKRRYPQTRQGVEQAIRETFLAARDYQREWDDYRKDPRPGRIPPRRDLQLEAVTEILSGKRLVHAHSYRADEILMLLRLAEEFGFHVATLQHVLEGYKIADEIARHGAGGSTFSDWWAYKYEVVDAIPYNGALMWERGVVTTFNSDSNELSRRLNLEAAKAVRYGNVPETEALKFVTLNSAIQLHVADRIGSLEAGKDADFVIWSGSPLSTYSVVEETWVDGRKYFDRAADLKHRDDLARERAALIAKVRAETKSEGKDRDKDKNKPGSKETTAGAPSAPGTPAAPAAPAAPTPPPPSYIFWDSNEDTESPFFDARDIGGSGGSGGSGGGGTGGGAGGSAGGAGEERR
jgi:imidazolonepropionase-like amidohydrolase